MTKSSARLKHAGPAEKPAPDKVALSLADRSKKAEEAYLARFRRPQRDRSRSAQPPNTADDAPSARAAKQRSDVLPLPETRRPEEVRRGTEPQSPGIYEDPLSERALPERALVPAAHDVTGVTGPVDTPAVNEAPVEAVKEAPDENCDPNQLKQLTRNETPEKLSEKPAVDPEEKAVDPEEDLKATFPDARSRRTWVQVAEEEDTITVLAPLKGSNFVPGGKFATGLDTVLQSALDQVNENAKACYDCYEEAPLDHIEDEYPTGFVEEVLRRGTDRMLDSPTSDRPLLALLEEKRLVPERREACEESASACGASAVAAEQLAPVAAEVAEVAEVGQDEEAGPQAVEEPLSRTSSGSAALLGDAEVLEEAAMSEAIAREDAEHEEATLPTSTPAPAISIEAEIVDVSSVLAGPANEDQEELCDQPELCDPAPVDPLASVDAVEEQVLLQEPANSEVAEESRDQPEMCDPAPVDVLASVDVAEEKAAEVGRRPSRGDARAEEVKRLFGEVERRVEEGWKKHLKPRGKALRSATCRIEISEASAQIRLNLKIKWRPRTVGLPAVLGATGLDPSDDDGHPPLDPAGFAPAARSFRAEHHVCGDTWSTGPSGGLLPTAEELAKTPEKRPPQELAKEDWPLPLSSRAAGAARSAASGATSRAGDSEVQKHFKATFPEAKVALLPRIQARSVPKEDGPGTGTLSHVGSGASCAPSNGLDTLLRSALEASLSFTDEASPTGFSEERRGVGHGVPIKCGAPPSGREGRPAEFVRSERRAVRGGDGVATGMELEIPALPEAQPFRFSYGEAHVIGVLGLPWGHLRKSLNIIIRIFGLGINEQPSVLEAISEECRWGEDELTDASALAAAARLAGKLAARGESTFSSVGASEASPPDADAAGPAPCPADGAHPTDRPSRSTSPAAAAELPEPGSAGSESRRPQTCAVEAPAAPILAPATGRGAERAPSGKAGAVEDGWGRQANVGLARAVAEKLEEAPGTLCPHAVAKQTELTPSPSPAPSMLRLAETGAEPARAVGDERDEWRGAEAFLRHGSSLLCLARRHGVTAGCLYITAVEMAWQLGQPGQLGRKGKKDRRICSIAGHSMDREQVDEVLTEFEATTSSIGGIEKKMAKVSQYMDTVQAQRMALGRQAEVTTSLIDGLGESMADQSQVLYDYFTSSFEHFAGLVEALETSLYNLKLEDAPRQIQREFGPLLVPSVVLVCIITASNCYFGFLLASDESLADALSARLAHPGGNTTDAVHSEMSEMNILFLFAVAHVVLIGLAIVYIVIDLFRRWCRRRRRSSGRFSLAGSFLDSEDEDELESVDEDQDEGGDESIDELPEANPVAGPAASQPAGQAERKSTSAPPDRSGDRLSVSTGNRVSWWSSRSSRRSQAPRVSVGKSNFHGASRGLRFSQLLRRVQHAALRDSPPRAVSEGIFRLSSGSRASLHKPTKEWAGICRVKDNEIAVRVAAASGSTVITTIANGRRIEVVQAIRGGRGKIWGRIASPPGWILLADQQTGFKAVAKVKEAVTSKPL
ncbi:unnamed protein product [Durusdinium trenchii]|uniref:Uncharacterized protein n=1 Tax=Durusdinium trenchii TaxID=1381693 RepID=A0ABP0MKC4_9DINO